MASLAINCSSRLPKFDFSQLLYLYRNVLKIPSKSLCYAPLEHPKRQIRLLEIIETFPRIVCRLTTVSLDDSPEFCALSYVWADAPTLETIEVNDSNVQVTKSLADALRYARHHWKSSFPEKEMRDFRLWADAVCINQSDLFEKNDQVPLMKEIYGSAAITLCSIASASLELELEPAFDTIKQISIHLMRSGFFGQTYKDQQAYMKWMDRDHPISQHQLSLPRDFQKQGLGWHTCSKQADRITRAILAFFNLKYWERAWIYQELVLSKSPHLFYKSHSIPLSQLLGLSIWATVASKQARPRDIDQFIWASLTHISDRTSIVLVGVARDAMRKLKRGEMPSDILYLLSRIGGTLKATNPKDHVYALLGICGLDVTPDYSENRTVASVYIEYFEKSVAAAIETGLSPLFMLEFAGYDKEAPDEHNLPSWAPNFPACSKSGGTRQILGFDDRESGLQRKEMPENDFRHLVKNNLVRNKTLSIPVLFITQLQEMSTTATDSKDMREQFVWSLMKLIGFEYRAAGFQPPDRPAASVHPLDPPGAGFEPPGCPAADYELPQSLPSAYRHPLLHLASAFHRRKIDGVAIWESPEVLRTIRALQMLLFKSSDSFKKKIFSRDFRMQIYLGPEFVSDLVHQPDYRSSPDFQRFLRFVTRVSDPFCFTANDLLVKADADIKSLIGARIARTAGNDFGLVPEYASEGDHVVFLAGSTEISLIRKVENHYVYVGPTGFDMQRAYQKLDEAGGNPDDMFETTEIR